MFNFVKTIFDKFYKKKPKTHYIVFIRGIKVYDTELYCDAENYIKITWKDVYATIKNKACWGSDYNISKRKAWDSFRNQCKIVKVN